MKRSLVIGMLLLLYYGLARAQDPQLSQFVNAPVYVNPALVGQTYLMKFSLHQRNQWMGTTGP